MHAKNTVPKTPKPQNPKTPKPHKLYIKLKMALEFTYWALTFICSIVNTGIQLNLIFSHEDLDDGYQEPYEISESLFKYTPYEVLLQ